MDHLNTGHKASKILTSHKKTELKPAALGTGMVRRALEAEKARQKKRKEMLDKLSKGK